MLIVILLVVAQIVKYIITSPNMQWSTIGKYLFSSMILHGVWITISLALVVAVSGFAFGAVVAAARLSSYKPFRIVAGVYTWLFRATPSLVVLLLSYNIAYFTSTLSIGIPFGPRFLTGETNHVVTPFLSAIIAFTLHQGAYTSEIIRASYKAIDPGQFEASKALGLPTTVTGFRVILPQLLKIAVPPMTNQLVIMTQGTTLVSLLGIADILFSAQTVYNRTLDVVPLLIVAVIWYLVIIGALTIVQVLVERRLSNSRSAVRATVAATRAGGEL
ncbi:ABC transporter permease subunit [Streptomyces sp. SID8361]|uniref:amino acid ABC transporter permease n=1 Tax=Streptomyces sp. MnatMP-M27 TaxID=1839768 RepID=UPI00081D57E4|nr:amino acid ABC transporter permease [Streptomyces sp. MnatMP-M27]MYU11170.1 ABC transporter permease subunit [Streptomyces sp. SID8361]SCF78885.1 polar amino acid transport system permease protein [Streptomyces sp. MnatMP-M27]